MDVMAKFSPGLRDFPGVEFCPLGASTITSQKLCEPSDKSLGAKRRAFQRAESPRPRSNLTSVNHHDKFLDQMIAAGHPANRWLF
mgnify:CR=1 FL=1